MRVSLVCSWQAIVQKFHLACLFSRSDCGPATLAGRAIERENQKLRTDRFDLLRAKRPPYKFVTTTTIPYSEVGISGKKRGKLLLALWYRGFSHHLPTVDNVSHFQDCRACVVEELFWAILYVTFTEFTNTNQKNSKNYISS